MKTVITGFNTDIEHDGIIYHVQTEDKGLETPLMLSLVYTGGAILASKRARYDDLIESGFDEKELAKRLLRQHKLICAALRAGRLDDLKKMTERDSSRSHTTPEILPADSTPPIELQEEVVAPAVEPEKTGTKPSLPKQSMRRLPLPSHKSSPTVTAVKGPEPPARTIRSGTASLESLHLVLIDETVYRGGDHVILCVRVENGSDTTQIVGGADVIVKILGSTFRPLIYQTKTSVDGIAVVKSDLPHFLSGRAAILIRVTVDNVEAELRRIIQQG